MSKINEPNLVSHNCEEKDCNSTDTILCEYSDENYTQTYLCPKHAEETGFCKGCGHFYCGTHEWDVHPGWCSTCYDEICNQMEDERNDAEEWEIDPMDLPY